MTRSDKRSLKQLRARLVELTRRFGGRFYWRNGVIRHAVYAPTKGWKERRWERHDVPGFAGEIDASAIDALF